MVALAISRLANILPIAALVNWLRFPHERITAAKQFVMWWAGLRGAMAFALAVKAAEEYGEDGEVRMHMHMHASRWPPACRHAHACVRACGHMQGRRPASRGDLSGFGRSPCVLERWRSSCMNSNWVRLDRPGCGTL